MDPNCPITNCIINEFYYASVAWAEWTVVQGSRIVGIPQGSTCNRYATDPRA